MVGGKMEVGVVEKEGEVSSEDWQIMAEEEEWNQKKEDRMADTKIAEPNALCGYPLVKMELEIQTRFLPQLPFSCNSIISGKIWKKMSLLLSIV